MRTRAPEARPSRLRPPPRNRYDDGFIARSAYPCGRRAARAPKARNPQRLAYTEPLESRLCQPNWRNAAPNKPGTASPTPASDAETPPLKDSAGAFTRTTTGVNFWYRGSRF